MTKYIECDKSLITVNEIQDLSGIQGIQATILVTESGNIYVDLVLPHSKKFWRLRTARDVADRNFKTIDTAVKLLVEEGFPEIVIKQDREFSGCEWIHVERSYISDSERLKSLYQKLDSVLAEKDRLSGPEKGQGLRLLASIHKLTGEIQELERNHEHDSFDN